jgi:hypothetical protein
LGTAAGKADLKGFDFNSKAPLKGVLFAPFALDTASGKITFTDFIVAEQVQFPEGATHVSLQGAVLSVDFETGFSDIAYSNLENLAIVLTPTTVVLTPTSMPTGGAVTMFLLSAQFFRK